MAKLRIEEAATKKQGRIDSGEDTIVGVNKYRLAIPQVVDVRSIDNTAVRESQTARLQALRRGRDESRTQETLLALSASAALTCSTGSGSHPQNLLKLAVEAARARATTGEISEALEGVWGRHVASTQVVQGAYKASFTGSGQAGLHEYDIAHKEVEAFAKRNGRRPRILVAKMGQDGHDRGAKVIASGFSDLGYDVDVGPLFSTPAEVARQAVDNDVHCVGVSSQAAGHRTLVPELVAALKAAGGGHIKVVCGGVIPPQDYDELRRAGAVAIFGPGTKILDAGRAVLAAIEDQN